MAKLLEKTLRDAIKENQYILGTKQVLSSLDQSKLVIISTSVPEKIRTKISEMVKKSKTPILDYKGTSVALGRLCGLQFHVSTVSLLATNESSVHAILGETSE